MTAQRDAGLQFALVKDVLDPKEQKREVEEKIRAAEEWNNLLLECSTNGYVFLRAVQAVVKKYPTREGSFLSALRRTLFLNAHELS